MADKLEFERTGIVIRLYDCVCHGKSDPVCGNAPITWSDFLGALEWFCTEQGWDLEYDSVGDESCAIFYRGEDAQQTDPEFDP